jgi:hypothetical protein
MNLPSPIPTAPSRRGFLAVLSAGAASAVAPAALAGIPLHVAETSTGDLPTSIATPSPDAALLQLFDEYLATDAEYRRLLAIFERGRKRHEAKYPMPDAMLVQPGDAELGLPKGLEHHPIWPTSYINRIEELKGPEWLVYETVEPPEGLQFYYESRGIVGIRYEPPSAATRARADEIIAACDKWRTKNRRYPRGLRSIEREKNRALKLKDRLRAKIDRTRALTIAGLAVKAQVAAIEGEDDTQFADTTLASILRDMKALNGRARL